MTKQELFNQVKVRRFPEKNYHAIWYNLKTIRIGQGKADELEPEYSEFFDVGINTKCNAECPFCYVSASSKGENYEGICDIWKKWMDQFPEDRVGFTDKIISTRRAFQVALGSTGEPTLNPEFCDFLETVFNTNVVPNYTTNGIILSYWDKPGTQYYELANKILEYTNKFVGGVAISYGNKNLRKYADNAIKGLLAKGDCKLNIHHIISDKESVDDFLNNYQKFGGDVYYHVLLPLMPSGRSKEGVSDDVWEYLEEKLNENYLENVSFGAHFYKYLKASKKISTWLYEPESFSKNLILKDNKVIITPSSFDLNPIKVIEV